ncbi:MAG TPA: proteinase IV, partial [Actinobacteria bacterium]|nr:proteinase IV [Actinomycetota bacterium]
TAVKINKWTSDATKDMISNIISPDAIKDSVMCFISAIYFKGQWNDKFLPENTKEEDFFLADRSTKKVQMMQNIKEYLYFEGDNFKMLRVPYGRNITAMHVILPDENVNINEFIRNLSTDLINEYIADSEEVEVMLKFPKFNIEYESADLAESLKNLGIKDAFMKDRADFKSISKQLFISQIEHKAIIEVNEEGTVAAAGGSFQGFLAERPVDFIVNRPFVLLIRDDRTENILFIGKILEP